MTKGGHLLCIKIFHTFTKNRGFEGRLTIVNTNHLNQAIHLLQGIEKRITIAQIRSLKLYPIKNGVQFKLTQSSNFDK